MASLPSSVTVIDEIKYTGALARVGLPGGRMAHALTDAKVKPKLLSLAARAAKAAEVDGALLGRVRGGGKGLEVVLVFVRADGESAVDTTVPLNGSEGEQKDRVRAALEPVFPTTAAAAEDSSAGSTGLAAVSDGDPSPDETAPGESVDPTGEEEDDDHGGDGTTSYVPNRPGSAIVGLGVSFALAGRFFSYREPAPGSTNLWPYEAFSAPAVHAALELYPAATTDVPFLKDLGFTGAYTHILGWTSHTDDERASFATRWQQLWGGLRYRIRTAEPDEDPSVIGISARFGWQAMVLEPDNPAAGLIAGEVPSAEYLMLGGQLDARVPIGKHFALLPAFGGYGVVDGGELYSRFASASYVGLDVSLEVAVVLDLGFELRAGAEYTGIFSWLEPAPGSTFVASGADDHFVAVRLGLGYVY